MDRPGTPLEALEQAIKIYGSQSSAGRARGVSQGTIWKWINRARCLPAEHVLAVEADTGVSRHALRPDIYPVDLPPSSEVVAAHHQAVACDRQALPQGAR